MDDLLKKYPSTDVFQANMLKNTQKKRIKSRLNFLFKILHFKNIKLTLQSF